MIVAILLITLALLIVVFKFCFKKVSRSVENKHFVITGGSSGIGKSLAVLLVKRGASVTIMARNVDKLKTAEMEIKEACVSGNQKVTSVSVDVSNYTELEQAINRVENSVGPIFGLINCAGMAICGKVEDYSLEDIQTLVNVNFLGTLYPIKIVVPKMKERKEGIIVITASQVALMGLFGYSVYSSCKFALRGLAESIDMELRPYNINVTLALPPDTDTPGFENENKTKPLETKLIAESARLFQPDEVANKILKDTLVSIYLLILYQVMLCMYFLQASNFFSYIGLESFLLTTLCVGMSPFSSLFDVLWQCLLLGPFRLVGCFYLIQFRNIIKKCANGKEL